MEIGDRYLKYIDDIPANRTECFIQEILVEFDLVRVNDQKDFLGFSNIVSLSRLVPCQQNKNITLTEDQLKELIKEVFHNGALSYVHRSGQPDTCWINVNDDMEEEVSRVCNQLNK